MRQSLHFLHPHPWHNSWSFQASRNTRPRFQNFSFSSVFVLQRAEGAPAAAKGSVCSHRVSPSQAARTAHTWQGSTGRDLPGDLSSIPNPVADLHPQRWGQIKAPHVPCCDTQPGAPALPLFLGGHPKPALDNPQSAPALGYGKATSAELPRKKVGKEKGIQCSGQRRRKEQAMNQIWNQWNPVVCSSWRSGVNWHPRN